MLQTSGLEVRFGDVAALTGVDLELPSGETLGVMGESGSGKSTLLRAIAGLVTPSQGTILWNGADLADVPTHRRRFGLMFQDYALFPHLDVAANVAFGLRMAGTQDARTSAVVAELLELVGLGGFGARPVDELSGGERQRVALARTLAPEPQLILLDEPLGALDRARRDQLLADMQQIFTNRGVGAIYVTHDHHEAFAAADRVAVLHEGRLVRVGSATELWAEPSHRAVAELLGFPVVAVHVSNGSFPLGEASVATGMAAGDRTVAIPPDAVRIDADGDITGRVVARRFEGGRAQAVVEAAGLKLLAAAPDGVTLGPVRVRIDASELKLLS